MNVDINDIELAIEFVSSDHSFDNEAYVNSETGDIYYSGDAVDEELPDDLFDNDKYIAIPTKRDLGLGKKIVLEFAAREMPDELDKVNSIFRSRGAYSRFKDLLHSLEYTEKWYAFENNAMKQAVIEWCDENSIPFKSDT
jgi:hypothetical protein